ncbi:hypothetical protein [Bordetella genomosp. 9]|uniref:hypothetical protein n=1 Tax=Bordetella genomosp. 9 TaxID=1416803 RepID=UPI0015C6744E|nr:hypothetical protein [Bordetella genomosp. 9]
MKQSKTAKKQHHHPERLRNVRAFAKSLLERRSSFAINTNQMRLAFARAVGMAQ